MKSLTEILEQQFKTLQIIMIAMRSLQRSLVEKDFDNCSTLIVQIKRVEQELQRLEKQRTEIVHNIAVENSVDHKSLTGEVLIALLPQQSRRPTRLILSQIKELTIHIKFLSQSISRFSNSVGGTMRDVFEELVTPHEPMYTEHGSQKQSEKKAILYDNTR